MVKTRDSVIEIPVSNIVEAVEIVKKFIRIFGEARSTIIVVQGESHRLRTVNVLS